MIGWLFRFFFLRFLPRRLLPIITIIEIARLARGMRRPRTAVNEPTDSRTGVPPRISPPLDEAGAVTRRADR